MHTFKVTNLIFVVFISSWIRGCDAPESNSPTTFVKNQALLFVLEPWATATPPGAQSGHGYMHIVNRAHVYDRLLSVGCSRAARVEFRKEEILDNNTLNYRVIKNILVPARSEIVLKPGGYYLSFVEIDKAFSQGEVIHVTLQFEHAGSMDAYLPVRPARM